MTKGRILLLENIHPGAMTNLEAAGYEVDHLSTAMTEEDLVRTIGDCVAIGVRSKTHITPKVLEAATSLRAVGAFCIGTNQIALDDAHRRGIAAFNAPFSNTRSVAELVMAEVVFLARRLADRNREMHEGDWRKTSNGCHEIRGKNLGIIGYGHIGRQVGVLAEAFGMHVSFYDIASRLPMGNNKTSPDLDALLASSDFVTLHVPSTPQTANMIGADELAKMKPGAHLLNLSRGNVVVLEELRDALKSGQVGGAAVDVYPKEPKTNNESFETPLQGLENVILTPHIGGSTVEAQVAIGQEVSNALIRFLDNGATLGSVNYPEASLAVREGVVCRRLQHFHRNVPGVLGDVHRIVAQHKANIVGQVLVTDDAMGYLLMDIAESEFDEIVTDIAALKTTVRARRLF